jgi:hypothetical protein
MNGTVPWARWRAWQWRSLASRLHWLPISASLVLAAGCHGVTDTPTSPSVFSALEPTRSASAIVTADAEAFTVQAAPDTHAMNPVADSGYAGTCTVASTHAGGFRLRAQGQGIPDTRIRFHLVDMSTFLRTTDFIEVNRQGAFRTRWDVDAQIAFSSGDSVECWLTSPDDSSTPLARSTTFAIP